MKNLFIYFLFKKGKKKKINALEDIHSLAKCSLASAGLLCEQWNSTLCIRHSQFAYTIDGTILWSAGVSRGGAECLFFFRFTDSPENGTGERFRYFFCLSLLSGSTRHNTSKTDCQLSLAAAKEKNKQTS